MSDDFSKFAHSKRRASDENAIRKQQRIVRQHGPATAASYHDLIQESNRFNKHHAMDCGRTQCGLCGNPRKSTGEITAQEKRLFQDIDCVRNKHSNGSAPDAA